MEEILRQRMKYIISDYLTLNAGWLGFNIARYSSLPVGFTDESLGEWLSGMPLIAGQIVVPVIMLLLYALSGYYNKTNTLYKSRLDEFLNTVIVSFIGMLGIYFTALLNDDIPERMKQYELMMILFAALFGPTCILRLVISTRAGHAVRRGRYAMPTIIVGTGHDAEKTARKIMSNSDRSGLKIAGFTDPSESPKAPKSIMGLPVYSFSDLRGICRSEGIKAIVILPSPEGVSRTVATINSLYLLGLPLFITPALYHLIMMRPRVSSVITEPLVDITNANISPATVNLKRMGDIIVSALALVGLAPVYAAIAIAVKLDSPGPAFYRQERIGYHKKPFNIIKFRTMRSDAEKEGPSLSSPDDSRITRTGHFLRKYRLDELPQFWNVLKGEMSIVGPRPEREYYIRKIVERQPAYSLIHQVRPGITSWGMVKFGYAANVDEMIERLRYDLLYIENVSLGVDLKILFHTVDTVLTGKGI